MGCVASDGPPPAAPAQQMKAQCPKCSKMLTFQGVGMVTVSCPNPECHQVFQVQADAIPAPGKNMQSAQCPQCSTVSKFEAQVGAINNVICGRCRFQFKCECQAVDQQLEAHASIPRNIVGTFPEYWSNALADKHGFDQMLYVSPDKHTTFNEILRRTMRDKATQDRPCPKSGIGPANIKCARTRGGCPCVQPGADPGLPVDYKVRRVIRVEDAEMWAKYWMKRKQIQAKRTSAALPSVEPAVSTDEICDQFSQEFEQLDSKLNEVYLWHGTGVRTALSIAQDDFCINRSAAGGMYGRGAYFAESSTKSDEYANDEPNGYYDGIYALLLCRACLGKFYYTEQPFDAQAQVESGEFDSCVGDRLKTANTFREFVLYDADQVYPEYIVLYNRVLKNDNKEAMEQLANVPFHMELPVYWTNCHNDPGKVDFHTQFIVNESTLAILQKFVDISLKGTGTQAKVAQARRVENAKVWMSYVQFKQSLFSQNGRNSSSGTNLGGKLFPSPEELDGNPESGHIKTFLQLTDSKLHSERAISVMNLDTNLNEHMFWHGTTRHVAEVIAKSDFEIPKASNQVQGGGRFGVGAYFAEDMATSLHKASVESGGAQYILLCRALCGNMHYTEKENDPSAHEDAAAAGKHAIMANPCKKGPREFVLFNAQQVYAEYILEVHVDVGACP